MPRITKMESPGVVRGVAWIAIVHGVAVPDERTYYGPFTTSDAADTFMEQNWPALDWETELIYVPKKVN